MQFYEINIGQVKFFRLYTAQNKHEMIKIGNYKSIMASDRIILLTIVRDIQSINWILFYFFSLFLKAHLFDLEILIAQDPEKNYSARQDIKKCMGEIQLTAK